MPPLAGSTPPRRSRCLWSIPSASRPVCRQGLAGSASPASSSRPPPWLRRHPAGYLGRQYSRRHPVPEKWFFALRARPGPFSGQNTGGACIPRIPLPTQRQSPGGLRQLKMGPDRVARLDRHQPAFTGHKPACGPLLVIFPFLSAAPPISLALEKKPCPFSSIASPRILPPPKPASWPATAWSPSTAISSTMCWITAFI